MKYRNKIVSVKSQLRKRYIDIPLNLKLNRRNWIKTPKIDFKFTDFEKFHQQYFKNYDFIDIDFYEYLTNLILNDTIDFEKFPENVE